MASLILITMANGRGHCAWWQSCTVPNQTHRGNNNKKRKMYAIKQIKICAEYRDMLPRPRLDLSGTPGLRPIGLSPGSWQTSLGLGSMSRYSAQILICILEKLCGWHLWKWQRVIIGASRFIDPVHMTSHKIQTGAKIRMNEKATKCSTVHHSFDGNRVILQCGAVITWSIFSHKRHPRAWGWDMRYLLFCLCHCSDLTILWYVGSRYNGTVLYLISTNIRRLINGRYVFCRNLIWPGIAISYSLFSAISQPNPISYVPSSIP